MPDLTPLLLAHCRAAQAWRLHMNSRLEDRWEPLLEEAWRDAEAALTRVLEQAEC